MEASSQTQLDGRGCANSGREQPSTLFELTLRHKAHAINPAGASIGDGQTRHATALLGLQGIQYCCRLFIPTKHTRE
jgi:hypothetical protein